jgi:lysophospholipase L1-like esterase
VRAWPSMGLAALAVASLILGGCEAVRSAPQAGAPPGLPSVMVALGDSLTSGVGSCAAFRSCPDKSWSTGTDAKVNSHYSRILAANPKIKVRATNLAERGARAADLAAQATKAVQAKPQYVTVLIGSGDACAKTMTPVGAFRNAVDAALSTLKSGLPEARILVVSIPDLYRLWQLGHTDDKAVRAWNDGVCPSLLANPTSTAAADNGRRRRVADRVDAYDDALAAACEKYGKHCRWDGGSAHRVRFSLDLVNHIDYFHPSAKGQDELAAVTYPKRFTW